MIVVLYKLGRWTTFIYEYTNNVFSSIPLIWHLCYMPVNSKLMRCKKNRAMENIYM